MTASDQVEAVVYLSADTGVLGGLAREFRLLQPPQAEPDAVAAFIREVSEAGPVHLVTESAGGVPACWVAIRYPELVRTLVLVAPGRNADLEARLSEVQAPTLILADTSAPSETAQVYKHLIPDSYRVYVYGSGDRFVQVATDFLHRGDAFVVKEG